jgi:uroporphyrinogen III methyltransferase/synthase
MSEGSRIGKVYLVGAGPGDVGLLTLRGAEVLSGCEVVVYDALVNEEILAYAPTEAERIGVGEAHGEGRLTQSHIIEILIDRARQGRRVVRLKGGDPLLFGRGGEEARALRAAGIPYEIVPGVSAGLAVPAYAGIPLTHRGISSSVAFVTGHECAAREGAVRWEALAQAAETLVIFMGGKRLPQIVERLLRGGLGPETPIALIERGTYDDQRVRVATLGTVRAEIEREPLRSPVLIVVGEVVRLSRELAWFPMGELVAEVLEEEVVA